MKRIEKEEESGGIGFGGGGGKKRKKSRLSWFEREEEILEVVLVER